MQAPVWRLPKKEIIKLAKWRCQHSHSGLEHYSCYLKENTDKERVGFLDIEASNLEADFGIVLCYCIADLDSDRVQSRVITKHELSTVLDKNVVEQCIKDMGNYDRLWGYYSSNFDIPFLRTRAVALQLSFPEYGILYHNDLYYLIRNKFKLSRNRLDNACVSLLGNTSKTRITSEHWIKALQGNKDSLDYIQTHCREDVLELKRLYERVIKYRKIADTSI